jgi:hypothetical protein
MRYIVALWIASIGCSNGEAKPSAKAETNQSNAKVAEPSAKVAEPSAKVAEPKPAAGAALPGDCAPLPALADVMDVSEVDLDGDGVKDLLVPVDEANCNKYDCPKTAWVVRGACGHRVGVIDVGRTASIEVTSTKEHGLVDVRVSGDMTDFTYKFDGTEYRGTQVASHDAKDPNDAKDDGDAVIAPQSLADMVAGGDMSVLAKQVKVRNCDTKTRSSAETATWLAENKPAFPKQRKCDTECCTFKVTKADGLGDVDPYVQKLCGPHGKVTSLTVSCYTGDD